MSICSVLLLSVAIMGQPIPVAHRGLFRDAPENTLSAFGAALDLRLGFELDIRRTKDGVLVCLHDDALNRTTDGKGSLRDIDLRAVKRLDAGKWFDPAFTGERVPTLAEVFALVQTRGHKNTLVALDLKIDDGKVEAEVVALAKKHGILSRVVFIGTTIDSPAVRKRILDADKDSPVAVLAQKREDLDKAVEVNGARWAYLRFLPTKDEVARIHRASRNVIVVGTLVAGNEPKNWRSARDAGVDAVLTDFPLDFRRAGREK